MFPALVEYMDSRESLRRLNNFTARAVRQGTAYQSLHDELQQGGRPLTVLSRAKASTSSSSTAG